MSAASADNRITEKVQTDGINITKDHVKMVFCVGKSYKIGIIVSNIDYNTYTKYNRSMERNLYHGSKTIIEKPIFGFGNIHNDYGLGFYCCGNKNLAREWAVRKNDEGILNKYTLRDDRLKIIDLTQGEYSNILIWISLLVKNRSDFMELQKNYPREIEYLFNNYYIDLSKYDTVIGYRADDAYFRFPEAFIRGQITLEGLEEIYRLGDLGKQYVLLSKRSFDLLRFVDNEEVQGKYHQAYVSRMINANDRFKNLLQTEQYKKGTRIRDLL